MDLGYDRRWRPNITPIRLLLILPLLALMILVYLFLQPIEQPRFTGGKLIVLDSKGRPTEEHVIAGFLDSSCLELVTSTGLSFPMARDYIQVIHPSGEVSNYGKPSNYSFETQTDFK